MVGWDIKLKEGNNKADVRHHQIVPTFRMVADSSATFTKLRGDNLNVIKFNKNISDNNSCKTKTSTTKLHKIKITCTRSRTIFYF